MIDVSLPPPLPPTNPYAAPVARVVDYQEGQWVLADRGIRLVAKIVDGLVFGLVAGIAIAAAIVLPAMSEKQSQGIVAGVFALIGIAAFLFVVIYNMLLLHRHGQTIGKRLFNIRILRSDGSHCDLLRVIFARWLPVTLLGAIPLIGYVVSLVDPLMIFRNDQRCWHDLLADTIVVKI
jgi:uncharacterized RDD family membrane protein YckC